MDEPRTKHALRCAACKEKPLLAIYGVDSKGHLYVHQKVFKAGRVFGESLFYGGVVRLKCRDCHHWNKVVFRDPTHAALEPTAQPEVFVDNPS